MDAIGSRCIKVSIIVPVYMAEPYLEKCIRSAMGQTIQEIEILAINDCSPDQSLVILRRLQKEDCRIRIIDLPHNRGVSNARNIGIKEAIGEFVMFLDSDDYLENNAVSLLYALASEGYDVVRASMIKEDDVGNIIDTISPCRREPITKLFGFSSSIFRRNSLIERTAYFPDYKIGEAWLFMRNAGFFLRRSIVLTFLSAIAYRIRSHLAPINMMIPKAALIGCLCR